jgi:hypothetical protein
MLATLCLVSSGYVMVGQAIRLGHVRSENFRLYQVMSGYIR